MTWRRSSSHRCCLEVVDLSRFAAEKFHEILAETSCDTSAFVSSFRLLLEDLVSEFGRESIYRREFLLRAFAAGEAASETERGKLFPALVFANA